MDTTKAGSIAQGNTQSDYKTWRKSDTVLRDPLIISPKRNHV